MSTAKELWYEGFFSGLWIDIQRQVKDDQEGTLAEARFIADALGLEPGSRVIDAPCGIGRHSVLLAEMGYAVTGIDLTPEFIEEARRYAQERGVTAELRQGDMRELPGGGDFDAVSCFWGSFGYFDDAGNAEFLAAVERTLRPGGRFLVDTHVAETLLPKISRPRDWRRVNDSMLLEERTYDFATGRTDTHWTVLREGETFEKMSSIRLYTYRELVGMMKDAGLVVQAAYGSLEKEPFGLGSKRLYLVAEKP